LYNAIAPRAGDSHPVGSQVDCGFPLLRTNLIKVRLRTLKAGNPQSMSPVSLASLGKGARGVILDVRDDAQSLGDEAQSTVSRRLLELGFVAGEPFEVISVVWPGGDPMAVRLGNTTFALRRREASAVLVETETARSGA
jgi:ferrous iron transport protein A